jgi:hypothetical protein
MVVVSVLALLASAAILFLLTVVISRRPEVQVVQESAPGPDILERQVLEIFRFTTDTSPRLDLLVLESDLGLQTTGPQVLGLF